MESATEAVADIFFNDRETIFGGFRNDSITDDTHGAARLQGGDGSMHRVERTLGNGPRLFRNGTNEIGFRLIRMPAVDDRRYINVDDVAIFKDVVTGDPMANDVVNARAAALCVAQIAKRSGLVFMFGRIVINESINFAGRNPSHDLWSQIVHKLSVKATCTSHVIALGFSKLELSEVLEHCRNKFWF